jgi:hypothetical protein
LRRHALYDDLSPATSSTARLAERLRQSRRLHGFPSTDRRNSFSIQWSWNGQGLIARLDFVKATVFTPADFTMLNDGVVRLNLEMVRMVLAKVSG